MEFITDRNTEEIEKVVVAEADAGQRADIYLAVQLGVSRSNMRSCWTEGQGEPRHESAQGQL